MSTYFPQTGCDDLKVEESVLGFFLNAPNVVANKDL
mgnify:CR=1 FL=1